MKSVMTQQQYFNHVSSPNIQRSSFNRSHGHKTTFNAGLLIPIYSDEVLPGDTFNVKANVFGRLSTPYKPIMDNMFMDIHFWFVPNRLTWENWEKFNGQQDNPGDTTNYLVPTITAPVDGFDEGSIYDYLGIPTQVGNLEVNALYFRAINKIWNEWYRDENLQNSRYSPTDDGPDTYTNYNTPNPRGKRKDYFTSALPFAQKAAPVSLPLGGQAALVGSPLVAFNAASTQAGYWLKDTPPHNNAAAGAVTLGTVPGGFRGFLDTATDGISYAPRNTLNVPLAVSGVYADLSTATAITINALRESVTVQQLYELDARGGTRYTEILRAHFGVISPDARLQRPEFLGGATSYINVNPIAQTSASAEDQTPQGNLAAMGTFSLKDKGFVKSFTEHGVIIGLASVRADLTYQQGLDRKFSRSTRFDYYWPSFANLGEQTILNKEIYAQGTSADDLVFGYQERFAEYRYKNSYVTGQFRSNSALSLDVWHLSQDFSALPALNQFFVEEQPPIARVVTVSPIEVPSFIMDSFFDETTARPMPTFSTPGLTKF